MFFPQLGNLPSNTHDTPNGLMREGRGDSRRQSPSPAQTAVIHLLAHNGSCRQRLARSDISTMVGNRFVVPSFASHDSAARVAAPRHPYLPPEQGPSTPDYDEGGFKQTDITRLDEPDVQQPRKSKASTLTARANPMDRDDLQDLLAGGGCRFRTQSSGRLPARPRADLGRSLAPSTARGRQPGKR